MASVLYTLSIVYQTLGLMLILWIPVGGHCSRWNVRRALGNNERLGTGSARLSYVSEVGVCIACIYHMLSMYKSASRIQLQQYPFFYIRRSSKLTKFDERGPNFPLVKYLLQSESRTHSNNSSSLMQLSGRDKENARAIPNTYKLRAFDTALKAIDNLTFQITPSLTENLKEVTFLPFPPCMFSRIDIKQRPYRVSEMV